MTSESTFELATGSGKRIPVRLLYSDRRTLAISVYPDCSVEVIAPIGADLDRVRERVGKRLSWIRKQQWFFESLLPRLAPRRFVPGETHHYLGRQYRLRLERGPEREVKLRGGYLHVTTPAKPCSSEIADLLSDWYRSRAEQVFERKLVGLLPKLRRLGIDEPKVSLRRMKRRWGSCTADGHILLNPDLVMTPSHCVEYVIAHELCHLVHPDHGKRFQRLLVGLVPDWEKRKRRLDSFPFGD